MSRDVLFSNMLLPQTKKAKLGLAVCLLLLVILLVQFYTLFLNLLLIYSKVGQIQNPAQWIQVVVIELWRGGNLTSTSAPPAKPTLCGLPANTGTCRGLFERYYYSPEKDECLHFAYGGCEGNQNNFHSIKECLATCKNGLLPKTGVVSEVTTTEETSTQGREKVGAEVCGEKREPGMCRAYMPRFFFNSESQKCEEFIYGGCGGNGNNFKAKEDCEKTCAGKSSKRADEVCGQSADPGPCRAAITRFYFDTGKQDCLEFTYGGCDGNDNNFKTAEDCTKFCFGDLPTETPKSDDICLLPPEMGKCRALFERYHYDAKKKKCVEFTYGGCGGNENNFKTQKECAERCAGHDKENPKLA